MTEFESYTIVINAVGVVAALLIVIVAIWGEWFRHLWVRPKLEILVEPPHFNTTTDSIRGWYYILKIQNKRRRSPAKNVRVQITRIFKMGPDGNWREQIFSGPVEISWMYPYLTQSRPTLGPDERATIGSILENSDTFNLSLPWIPNNLIPSIQKNEKTRINIQAVSDIAESEILILEISWDGIWREGIKEMQQHCIVNKVKMK